VDTSWLSPLLLIEPENPCPLGMVRVQRLCHLNDSLILHNTELSPQSQ
jgi:hypothetical protein